MQTFLEMQNAVVNEGGVDTTTTAVSLTTVKARLNDRYTDMVVRAKWRKAEVSLGATVADQAEYTISDPAVRELEQVRVGTAGPRLTRVGQEDLWDIKSGARVVNRSSTGDGVFAPDYTATGTDRIELYPAPDTAGDTLYGLAVLAPVALVADGDVPIVPEEFVPYIVYGAIGWFMGVVDERQDEAAVYEQQYEAGVDQLRRRRNMRFGHGVVQLQVAGYHF